MDFTRYTLCIGLNDKDTKTPVMDVQGARYDIGGRLGVLGVGATITVGTGVYKHEDGAVVVEETIIVQVIDFDGSFKKVMRGLIESIKRDYNQESIAVMEDKIRSELV